MSDISLETACDTWTRDSTDTVYAISGRSPRRFRISYVLVGVGGGWLLAVSVDLFHGFHVRKVNQRSPDRQKGSQGTAGPSNEKSEKKEG